MSPYLKDLTSLDISSKPVRRTKPTWQRRAELAYILVIVAISLFAAAYHGGHLTAVLP
jgi:hypothetical protein